MSQIAHNLTDCEDGFLNDSRYLIHNRDPLFTMAFRDALKFGEVEMVNWISPLGYAHDQILIRTLLADPLMEATSKGIKTADIPERDRRSIT